MSPLSRIWHLNSIFRHSFDVTVRYFFSFFAVDVICRLHIRKSRHIAVPAGNQIAQCLLHDLFCVPLASGFFNQISCHFRLSPSVIVLICLRSSPINAAYLSWLSTALSLLFDAKHVCKGSIYRSTWLTSFGHAPVLQRRTVYNKRNFVPPSNLLYFFCLSAVLLPDAFHLIHMLLSDNRHPIPVHYHWKNNHGVIQNPFFFQAQSSLPQRPVKLCDHIPLVPVRSRPQSVQGHARGTWGW